jgi:hypothetical protein
LALLALVIIALLNRFRQRALVGACGASAILGLSLVPWAARNARLTGEWKFLTYRAGISLYDGVGPDADGSSNLGSVKAAPAVAGMNEIQWNRHFLDESWRAIQANPWRVARLALIKLERTWNPFPNVREYQSRAARLVSAGWAIPTFALALGGAIALPILHGRRGLHITLILLLPAIYLSVLHSFFVGSVRYRLGAIPMFAVLAAYALSALYGALIGPSSRRRFTG